MPWLTSGNTAPRSMQRCGSGLHRLTRDDTGGQPCTAAEVILSSRTRRIDPSESGGSKRRAPPASARDASGGDEIFQQRIRSGAHRTVVRVSA